jgi:hypothetical protein
MKNGMSVAAAGAWLAAAAATGSRCLPTGSILRLGFVAGGLALGGVDRYSFLCFRQLEMERNAARFIERKWKVVQTQF